MKKILIIEHDRTVGSIYRNKFALEGFQVEVAEDGEAGLAALIHFRPELVVLDLTLPKISGVELIQHIRASKEHASLPIVVLANAYNAKMIEEAWQAGATKCLTKMDSPPRLVLRVVRSLLASSGPHDNDHRPLQAAESAGASPLPDSEEMFHHELRRSFLDHAPEWLATLRSLWSAFVKADSGQERLPLLFELYRKVHSLTGNAVVAESRALARMSAGLETLLRELHEKPKHITSSTMHSVAQSLDFLRVLVERMPFDQDEQLPQASILVVDDELMSRLAITHALEKAHLRALSVEDAALALRLLEENPFDLVVADVDMPGMTGIQLCEKLRERPASKHTPVVFVSRLDDFQTQAKARLSGGNDYITKPFLPIELAVKALIHIMRGQLPQEKKAAA